MSIISIYVGNLPYSAKAEELKEMFARHGEVSRATIILDRETNRPRGFAFIEMTSEKEAEAAVAALAGHDFQGRPLTVNCARNNVVRGAGNTSQAAMRPATPAPAATPAAAPPATAGTLGAALGVLGAPAAAPPAVGGAPSRGYHNRLRENQSA